jgi:hypothetical protein
MIVHFSKKKIICKNKIFKMKVKFKKLIILTFYRNKKLRNKLYRMVKLQNHQFKFKKK